MMHTFTETISSNFCNISISVFVRRDRDVQIILYLSTLTILQLWSFQIGLLVSVTSNQENVTVRLNQLQTACDRMKAGHFNRSQPYRKVGRVFVDHYLKVVYCPVAKVATTSWNAMFQMMVEESVEKRKEWWTRNKQRVGEVKSFSVNRWTWVDESPDNFIITYYYVRYDESTPSNQSVVCATHLSGTYDTLVAGGDLSMVSQINITYTYHIYISQKSYSNRDCSIDLWIIIRFYLNQRWS